MKSETQKAIEYYIITFTDRLTVELAENESNPIHLTKSQRMAIIRNAGDFARDIANKMFDKMAEFRSSVSEATNNSNLKNL